MAVKTMRIGTLDDDLTSIAGAVHHQLFDGPRLVWIDDRRRVFIGDPGGDRIVPTPWIVGTFGYGHALDCIEEDLRAMAQERAHHSMMDRPDTAA